MINCFTCCQVEEFLFLVLIWRLDLETICKTISFLFNFVNIGGMTHGLLPLEESVSISLGVIVAQFLLRFVVLPLLLQNWDGFDLISISFSFNRVLVYKL